MTSLEGKKDSNSCWNMGGGLFSLSLKSFLNLDLTMTMQEYKRSKKKKNKEENPVYKYVLYDS